MGLVLTEVKLASGLSRTSGSRVKRLQRCFHSGWRVCVRLHVLDRVRTVWNTCGVLQTHLGRYEKVVEGPVWRKVNENFERKSQCRMN